MQASRRQIAALGALAAVLAALLWVQREDGGAPVGPGPSAGPAGPPGGQTAEAPGVGDVRLDLLDADGDGQTDGARNPFEFGTPPAPPAPPAAEVAPPSPAPPVTRAAVTPTIPLRYIGRIELPAGAGRVAVLSDNRGHVFHGQEGDVIEGRYRVVRVGADSADLAHVDGRGQQTLELSGQ